MVEIIEAGSGHADAIARLHADNWKATYRGILPDGYLDTQVDWRAAGLLALRAGHRQLFDGAGSTG